MSVGSDGKFSGYAWGENIGWLNFSASNSCVKTAWIPNSPVANFYATPNPAACSQTISFDGSASYHNNPSHHIVRYAWDFNFNGDFHLDAIGATVSHTYSSFGTRLVSLLVTDDNVPAKTSMYSVEVYVSQGNQAPTADAGGPYVAVVGATNMLPLDGSLSSDPNLTCGDSIVSYSWNLAGGRLVLSGALPILSSEQITALGVGTLPVVLTVTDTFGATGTSTTSLSLIPGSTVSLNINKNGTGAGSVSSSPAGINCGSTCTGTYDYNTLVTLTAVADAGSTFSAWSGCDSATGAQCTVTMSSLKNVTATFALIDTIPDPCTFTNKSSVALNTPFISDTSTVSGINMPTAISITGGLYSINGSAFTSAAGTVNNGDSVRVQLTSSAAYATMTSATLTIGGVSATFSVTTQSAPIDTTPDQFSFVDQTGVALNTLVISNTITVIGHQCPFADLDHRRPVFDQWRGLHIQYRDRQQRR